MSKASRGINLSEDSFAGFNSTVRSGNITRHEYPSWDIYRLGHRFDFFRMMSCYFTTVGFYVSAMMVVIMVYAYLYGKLYSSLGGLENDIVKSYYDCLYDHGNWTRERIQYRIKRLHNNATATNSCFFTFSLVAKVHYFGRTLLHGGAKYRATGRGFVVRHEKLAENYRMFSRCHFTKGMELVMLLICYWIFGSTDIDLVAYILITLPMWFLVCSFLFAPLLFNPSWFEWLMIVEDWDDWSKWINSHSGIGVLVSKSWESRWDEEQEHLNYTGFLGRTMECILSLASLSIFRELSII
ncbi:hypothetical protein K1719_014554 [Acacia pycnantha]|nr:hypothetical protein K1719_014554 [Acacia pycnantha]